METQRVARILIVDEHGVYRRGLRSLIESDIRQAHVLEAGDLASAYPILFDREGPIDLTLIDFDCLPNHSLDWLRKVCDLTPATRFALLSASHIRADVLSCLAAGFHGFVHKLQSDTDLVASISDLLAGRIHVPAWVAGAHDIKPELGAGSVVLTPRQGEVLALLALGRSTKEIAHELNISEGTTKIHTAAVLRSLGARNRTEAVFKAANLIASTDARRIFQVQSVSEPTEEPGRVLRLRRRQP